MSFAIPTPSRLRRPLPAGRLHDVREAASRLVGRGSTARFLGFELAVWVVLYGAYLGIRGNVVGRAAEAIGRARALVDLEHTLGIAIEDETQALLNGSEAVRSFFATYYQLGFFPVVIATMFWLALRHRPVYTEFRTILLVAIAIASVVFILLPTAPPRLVSGLGIVDTVGMGDHDTATMHGVRFNPYAAMPSMHVGWTLLITLAALRVVRRRAARVLVALHPVVMTTTVVATGNHYVLDAVAGIAIAVGTLALVHVAPRVGRLVGRRAARLASPALRGATPVPGACGGD